MSNHGGKRTRYMHWIANLCLTKRRVAADGKGGGCCAATFVPDLCSPTRAYAACSSSLVSPISEIRPPSMRKMQLPIFSASARLWVICNVVI